MKAKVKTWLRNVENGNIRNFTEKILAKIKEETPNENADLFSGSDSKGISTHELRETTGISHQSATAILSALTDEGLIKATGEQQINDSTYSIYVFVYNLEYRKRLIQKRKEEKFVQWLKKADDYFEFLDHKTVEFICYEQEKKSL